ncbi:HAMP domain-containing histidine kinase [candidate division KSB1 bacterium]|nr:HAMP domain-containing histidine kinase [candidate division KSB1 bacterium]
MLNHAYRLELNIFKQNVNSALSSIVKKIEVREALTRMIKVTVGINKEGSEHLTLINMETCDSLKGRKEMIWKTKIKKNETVKFDSGKINFRLKTPQNARFRILDSLGQLVKKNIDEAKPAGKYQFAVEDSSLIQGAFSFDFNTDSSTFFMHLENGEMSGLSPTAASDSQRRYIVERVLQDLSGFHRVPLKERVNPTFLDSVINETLKEKGIHTSFTYGVISANNDSIILSNQKTYNQKLLNSDYKTRLFPYDIFVEKNNIALFFPEQTMYILRQIGVSAFLTFLFIFIIILCFIYVIRTIFKQKQFSLLLTDFINNMTHEFKTPISTIALTSETLTNPIILSDKERIKKYGQIIRDESTRMRGQVEKILQMAAFEEGDFELNLSRINVHDLIKNAVDKFVVKVEQREGSLSMALQAEQYEVEADSVHLENIIHNLVDNAIKYTKQKPEIKISTENNGDKIKISVKDNGMGIKSEDQKLVFEKYYRVPTGNVHNVKGFGLGLSYVKLIVEAHHGEINLISELDKGSVFEVILPL